MGKKKTQEEKSWEDYEMGWNEGYNDGVTDFLEVEKQKQKLRKKGVPVK